MNKRLFLFAAVLFISPCAVPAGILPCKAHKKTLENGLDVIVMETPAFANVLNVNTMILAGSRNEVEKGRTGLAHLFEHMAFRHKYDDPASAYTNRIERMGAFDNGWTWFDITYYHPVTFVSNLEEMVKLQAERFVSMDFSERIYRTEAGAVLGEYRRIASDPSVRMEEVQADLAYGKEHGYGHTTMGYLEDVVDMPNSYASGRAFYEMYYRPQNAVVIVAAPVGSPSAPGLTADHIFDSVASAYGPWKAGKAPDLPQAKPLEGPRRAHVDWESDVPPRISYAYRVPPFKPGTAESAVLAILPELLAGKTSPLFQKLRYEKKSATQVHVDGRSAQGFDSRLLEMSVRLDEKKHKKEGKALLDAVEKDIEEGFEELKEFSKRPDAERTLGAVQSKFRYDLLASLDSPHSIASVFAWYYRFSRDMDVLDRLIQSVDKLTPSDVDGFAQKHFVPANRVVVTMSYKEASGK